LAEGDAEELANAGQRVEGGAAAGPGPPGIMGDAARH